MEAQTTRDDLTTAGYQAWRHLMFLHWRVPVADLQPLLPEGLTAETFDGSAWLALVPFSMERVRPWWSPAIPGMSWFLETNLRTYVRHASGIRGVWFFSLDANSRLAVRIARTVWKLNYIDCGLSLHVDPDNKYTASGQRRSPHTEFYSITASLTADSPQEAPAGSLEEFLLERYTLLTQAPDGQFYSGQVHHDPYQYQLLSEIDCQQNYTGSLLKRHCDEARPPDHAAWSIGVDVRVSPLRRV